MLTRLALPCLLAALHAHAKLPPTQGQINAPFSMPDVNLVEDGGRVYAFGGTDLIPYDLSVTDFVMPYWRCFSSDDLVHWRLESTVRPEETYIGKSTSCWAGHGIKKDNRWYWYLSNHHTDTAVLTADTPRGPWKDVLGKPLLPADLTPTREYDPCAFIDDDGKAYLTFGNHDQGAVNYYIARLNDDMISLAEAPRKIVVHGDLTQAAHLPVDASFLHKANGKYYLTWRKPYAIADSPYGPYKFVGNQDARGHGGFFTFRHQSFVNYTTLKEPEMRKKYRFSSLAYVHYRDDCSIAPMEKLIADHGVGQYDATWPAIEAEWHMGTTARVQKKEIPTGFEMRNLGGGDFLRFPNIHDLPRDAVLLIQYAANATTKAHLSVRANEPFGPELGRAEITRTGAWDKYTTLRIPLDRNPAGTLSLSLVIEGEGEAELIRIDSFSVTSESAR